MFHDLTKAQKRALREAARLAHDRDTTMGREDRDVHYLQVRNSDLPIVVAGAVAHGIVRIDDVGEAARGLIEDLSARISAAMSAFEKSERVPTEEPDPYDPDAVVSIAAILGEIDFVTSSGDASLYVNTRTGEVGVSLGEGLDDLASEELEESEEWEYLLNRHELDEIGMMRKFSRQLGPAASQEILDALSGRGAFRRFRDVIHRRALEREWDEYRERRFSDVIRFELRERNIPFRR